MLGIYDNEMKLEFVSKASLAALYAVVLGSRFCK